MAVETFLWKERIAMLWVFTIFVGLARSSATSYQRLSAGEFPPPLDPASLLWGAGASLALFIIPFLCLTLKDSLNRIANIVLGTAFTLVGIAGTAAGATLLTASTAHLTLMDAAATMAPAVIAFYAYRWPKAESAS